MRRHASVAGVQEKGCGALWIIAVNAANKVSIAEAGGITVILDAMRRHAAVAGVQEQG
eukprot:CAMPEP_0184349966 /NCGR_PEP_ID=MMETSP1089-20130417/37391_1 /TAXON_ID=38269 ORGANISM="Gloeochaete wittrockiana, Strain SAG46.84" /NCGR_SAMPLE_ID=MMETSP1089 /ASSEMBLY_ACC=CAM_ASM_000445 /LENGTH=57 /DNA_ID=CAMNT_0026682499 /DNA_START=1 /DNA_END=170 /DNA_ORIENTATION=+